MKLNDLFFVSQTELENYRYTNNKNFIVKAFFYYKKYKDQGGKKKIKALEELF